MTNKTAVQWIAFATGMTVSDIELLGLTDEQARALGHALSQNRVLNPPPPEPKTVTFTCRRCGRQFIGTYTTRKLWYCPTCCR